MSAIAPTEELRSTSRMGRRLFVAGLALSPSLAVPASLVSADQKSGQDGPSPQDFSVTTYNAPITILQDQNASPYGSAVYVRGLHGGIADVNLTLRNFTHARPQDVYIMLEHLSRGVVVMGGAGDSYSLTGANIRLDDEAAAPLPNGPIVAQTAYKPHNYNSGITFGAPAPTPQPNANLSFFDGIDPNGFWTLYVKSLGTAVPNGSIGSWQLQITTNSDLPFITNDTYRTKEDQTLRVSAADGVLSNDGLSDRTGLSVARLTKPHKGTVKLKGNGSFVYNPKPHRRGRDTFTYRVVDQFGIVGDGKVTIIIQKDQGGK